jgi:DNA-binding beta-propeller fold protein YncE
MDHSAISGGILFANFSNGLSSKSGGNLKDIAVNKEGTRAYVADGGGISGAGYKCAIIDAVAGNYIGALPGGDPYPTNVEVTADGRVICGIDNIYGPFDFWVHSPQGAVIQGYKVGPLRDRQLMVTPDGFVVAALLNGMPGAIVFVPIGP